MDAVGEGRKYEDGIRMTSLRGIAAGDFGVIAQAFDTAGFRVVLPAPGMLKVSCGSSASRPGLLLSAGIHGDETAPIEMLERLLADMVEAPMDLAVDLMVVVGNLAAIAAGRRYIDVDMNRLFVGTAIEA